MCGRCRCSIRPDDVPRACHLPHTSVRQIDVDRLLLSYLSLQHFFFFELNVSSIFELSLTNTNMSTCF